MNARLLQSLRPLRNELAHRPLLHRLYSHLPQPLRVPDEIGEDDSQEVKEVEEVRMDWPADVKRPEIGLVKDTFTPPSWTKYQRFCETNGFTFGFLQIHEHDWLEQARQHDMVIGHPFSSPNRLEEIWRKTYILEHWLGKYCYPSTADLALYEDKHVQHDILHVLGLPVVPSWISYDREDALRLAAKLEYPVVSKLITAAGSRGVELLKNRAAAERAIRRAFSARGRYWHWPYLRQKDYILFQKLITTDGYDVRVMCLGNMLFGYYRRPRPGDFRASGSGLVEKRSIPESILRLAHSTAEALQSPYLSVDCLVSASGEPFITEVSHFNVIESAEQLHVEGVPGVYIMEQAGTIRFSPGRFWVQELALKRACEEYARAARARHAAQRLDGLQGRMAATTHHQAPSGNGRPLAKAHEMPVIASIGYRKILNSHVKFTTEFTLRLEDGSIGWAASPKGETISIYEDQNIPVSAESIIAQMKQDGCSGKPFDQQGFDDYLASRMDQFGRNNAYSLSLAFFKATQATRSAFVPFGWRKERLEAPRLCLNILNGGWHAYTNPVLSDFSELLLVANDSDVETVIAGHNALQRVVKERLRTLETVVVGGNRVHRFSVTDNRTPIEFLLQVREKLGLSRQFDLMIDASASDLWRENAYRLEITDGSQWTTDEFRQYWQGIIRDFGVVYLEDPFHEKDEEAWRALTAAQGTCRIIGDNFYSSDAVRIGSRGSKGCTHGVIIKPNQAGSVTAVRQAVEAAQRHGQIVIASHRSVSTEETFLSLLTCLTSVPFIKIGPLETDYSSVIRLNEILRLTGPPKGIL
jgi:enolase/glutathione synthase/RimK-type ligase-like ATP-grasp enzyme